MANLETENLYLLEFLVNDIELRDGKRCDCGSAGNELCVTFQFLDNQELQVCERDFDQEKIDMSTHKIGKSCIFSLTPQQANAACQIFNINVSVKRKLPPERSADDAIAGTSVICIAQLLTDLLEVPPGAKVLENKYELEKHGKKVGTIDVFIRLSCYGKAIVTQFQLNLNDKTVLFMDKEGRSLYRYRKRKSEKSAMTEDKAPDCPGPLCYSKEAGFAPYSESQTMTQGIASRAKDLANILPTLIPILELLVWTGIVPPNVQDIAQKLIAALRALSVPIQNTPDSQVLRTSQRSLMSLPLILKTLMPLLELLLKNKAIPENVRQLTTQLISALNVLSPSGNMTRSSGPMTRQFYPDQENVNYPPYPSDFPSYPPYSSNIRSEPMTQGIASGAKDLANILPTLIPILELLVATGIVPPNVQDIAQKLIAALRALGVPIQNAPDSQVLRTSQRSLMSLPLILKTLMPLLELLLKNKAIPENVRQLTTQLISALNVLSPSGNMTRSSGPMRRSLLENDPMGCCSREDTDMIYSPTVIQQAAVFPRMIYNDQMARQPRGPGECRGGCGR